MPDFKYAEDDAAEALSNALGYTANAKAAITEMWRQVGPLQFDGKGVAARGLLVRHLVLPNRLSQTEEVLAFLAHSLGKNVAVSLMAQYYPSHRAFENPLLCRTLQRGEYARALQWLEECGLTEGYVQELNSADNYLPDFRAEGHPFERE